jgi:8-oxo-dGTP pyrophosphatase MutT (NUDIX family)
VIEIIGRRLARYQPSAVSLEGHPQAAVLVPLYQYHGELRVVLTKRSETVASHKGEIAFPGGGVEAHDADCIAAALREAEEEIGLAPHHVRILGRLDDVITISNYHVSAFVGAIDAACSPYLWRPQPDEVAEVLEVPIAHLADAANLVDFPVQRNGETLMRQGCLFGEHIIWGATWRLLQNFLDAAVMPLGSSEAARR